MIRAPLGVIANALLLASCSTPEGRVDDASALFHQRLEGGRYDEIQAHASSELRAIPRERFHAGLMAIRRENGRRLSTTSLGGVATGDEVSVEYSSQFERGPAIEMFRYRLGDGEPVLTGFEVVPSR